MGGGISGGGATFAPRHACSRHCRHSAQCSAHDTSARIVDRAVVRALRDLAVSACAADVLPDGGVEMAMGCMAMACCHLLQVSIVVDQLLRLLHHCGMPKEDVDCLHGTGNAMGHVRVARSVQSDGAICLEL